LGLPFYMAPEVCRGGGDHRSDVYSLGCLLFHMTAGRPPYLGQSAYEIATAHQQMQVRGPASFESSIPYELDQLVQRMIAKETMARPQSMQAAAAELERIAHQYWPQSPAAEHSTMAVNLRVGSPPPARHSRKWIWIAGAVVVLGAGGGALVATKPWAHRAAVV